MHDLLLPYRDLVMVLSIILRIRRTLDGVEIDKFVCESEAQKALAAEHHPRVEWRNCELAVERSRAEHSMRVPVTAGA
ncbi:hypothetical protein ABIF64_000577 [Bradyrhizobium japonicum]|uniref:hypothetical protein n=1 Tax=Bradyrhizobium japonicum TaxID=375 RepID=UPI003397E07A